MMNITQEHTTVAAVLPTPDGGFGPCPTVMTEEELIRFLRIPEISSAAAHHHVIENLIFPLYVRVVQMGHTIIVHRRHARS